MVIIIWVIRWAIQRLEVLKQNVQVWFSKTGFSVWVIKIHLQNLSWIISSGNIHWHVLQKSYSRAVERKTQEKTNFVLFSVSFFFFFAVSDTLTPECNFIFLKIHIYLLPNSEIIIYIYKIILKRMSSIPLN